MSKSSELDKKAKLYLLEVISEDSEGNSYTISESIEYTRQRFESEYGYEIERVGRPRALIAWLQGLALNIEFSNHKILELAQEWGTLPAEYTERQADKILDNYWNFMANKLLQLFNYSRVPKVPEDYFIAGEGVSQYSAPDKRQKVPDSQAAGYLAEMSGFNSISRGK